MDLSTRIAPLYREKEMEIRNLIAQTLERGKVDFSLWVEKDAAETATPINAALVENYYNQIKTISETYHIPVPQDWFATLLRMPDVLTRVDVQELSEEEWTVVRQAVSEALQHLVDFRKQEGQALEKKFTEKIDNIERLLQSIEVYEKERVTRIRERITDALEKTISVDYDKNRLEQELIYYIEKLDINEENSVWPITCAISAKRWQADTDKARSWDSSPRKWDGKSIPPAASRTTPKCRTSWYR